MRFLHPLPSPASFVRHGSRRAAATISVVMFLAVPSFLEAQTPPLPDTVIPVQGVEVEVFRRPLGSGNVPFAVSVVEQEALQTGTSGLSLEEAIRGRTSSSPVTCAGGGASSRRCWTCSIGGGMSPRCWSSPWTRPSASS